MTTNLNINNLSFITNLFHNQFEIGIDNDYVILSVYDVQGKCYIIKVFGDRKTSLFLQFLTQRYYNKLSNYY